jgi:hypothetical protein
MLSDCEVGREHVFINTQIEIRNIMCAYEREVLASTLVGCKLLVQQPYEQLNEQLNSVLNLARVRKYITDNAVSQTPRSFQRCVLAFVLSYRCSCSCSCPCCSVVRDDKKF